MQKSYIKSNNIEVRVSDGGKLFLKAFLPTEKLSHNIYHKEKKVFFKEKVSRGSFSKSIDKENLKILLQHDYSKEMKSECIEAYETEEGLCIEATIYPNMELLEAIVEERITGVIYGFVCSRDRFDIVNGQYIRTILEFDKIMEISILHSSCEPCYPLATAIVTGDKTEIAKEEIKTMKKLINKIRTDTMKRDVELMRYEINRLKKGM